MDKLIIEARINEHMRREAGNPNVPYLPDEIAADALACAKAGASVLHFHARQPNGKPAHGTAAYEATVRSIRARSDILIHPTLGDVSHEGGPEQRLAHIVELAKDPASAPHMAPVDMGSVNLDVYNPQARRFETSERIYKNSTGTHAYLLSTMRKAGVKPYLSCWNIGFIRQAVAFMDMGVIEEPAYMGLILTENSFLGGHPGTMKGLLAHVDMLPPERRIVWTVLNYGGNLLPLAGAVIAMGGHISIGIGDYTYPELGHPTNAELIGRVVAMARDAGREIATPAEARRMLAIA
jgi:3-keto-5-aminohexanoate cleavage enzyme